MTILNKNYQTIDGATDKVSDIDARHNTAMTEIEADMGTIETDVTTLQTNNSGTNTGDQTSLTGISDTKANFDTAVSDGNITFDGDAPTAHATSHTDASDDIQSATALQKGLATATQITKLDGIEEGADVTDAGNVNAVESDPIVGAVNGIVKADGAGAISSASAGTDYQAPLTADTDYLTPGTAGTTYEPLKGDDDNYVTDAEKTVIGNTSGSNSGDNAVNTNYSSLIQYTDEMAQDAVGGMVDGSLTYTDGTPELKVTNPVTAEAAGFTISAGTTPKTLTVADTASVTGTNTGDQSASDFNHDDLANITGTASQYNHPTDAQMTVLGNTSNTNTGDQTISDETITTSDVITNNMSTSKHGFAPKGTGTAGQFLNSSGGWSAPSGSGDTLAPATNTDNYIPQWDGADSKTLKNGVSLSSVTPPVKASGAEINTGTDDAKFVTAKAIADSTVGASWTSWTPTFTGITLGNGTLVARYTKIGKTIHGVISLTVGSTTTIAGTNVNLPVTPKTTTYTADKTIIGNIVFIDTGTAYYPGNLFWDESSSTCNIYIQTSSGTYTSTGNISGIVPFTWTTGDELSITFTYEAA